MVGTQCNMQCEYCYEHVSDNKGSKKIASVEEVIKYLGQFVKYDHVLILFHGGEPLLADIQEVERIVSFAASNFMGLLNIQFQTNGILLSDKWIQLFKEYQPYISVSVSLDPVGIKDLRKSRQYSNYRETVMANIKKCLHFIGNVGIVSVAHRLNASAFNEFIEELTSFGVCNLTINKYISSDRDDPNLITELEYVDLLKKVFTYWIENKLYRKISIQPLASLFGNSNKLCIYLPDENKCTYFKTFNNENNQSDFCDHITDGTCPVIPKKCFKCDIYEKCGSGCLAVYKDETFCQARRELLEFVKAVKHEN